MRSQNLTSKVRSIYVNSVIVASRNLDRISEQGGKRHYISFHSSSEDKRVKCFRKVHFFYLVFKLVILNLTLYPAVVLRAYVQSTWGTLWSLYRFLPQLCDAWLPSFISSLDWLVNSSQWTYLSSQAKVSVSWALLLRYYFAFIKLDCRNLTRRESMYYCAYLMDEKVEVQSG